MVEKYGLVVIANFESAQRTVPILLGRWPHFLKGEGGRRGVGGFAGERRKGRCIWKEVYVSYRLAASEHSI